MWPGRNRESTKNCQKIFSNIHINMKRNFDRGRQEKWHELAEMSFGGVLFLQATEVLYFPFR